jgi:hypothetical protein
MTKEEKLKQDRLKKLQELFLDMEFIKSFIETHTTYPHINDYVRNLKTFQKQYDILKKEFDNEYL